MQNRYMSLEKSKIERKNKTKQQMNKQTDNNNNNKQHRNQITYVYSA